MLENVKKCYKCQKNKNVKKGRFKEMLKNVQKC